MCACVCALVWIFAVLKKACLPQSMCTSKHGSIYSEGSIHTLNEKNIYEKIQNTGLHKLYAECTYANHAKQSYSPRPGIESHLLELFLWVKMRQKGG